VKFSVSRIAQFLVLVSVFTAFHQTEQNASGQTPAATPSSSPAQDKNASVSNAPQEPPTQRERRAKAYAKLLEGQRYLSDLRRDGNPETLRQARQAFQDAATLDPALAEAHTALAEIAFYYPPQDFEAATREGINATRIDPDNFGAHHLLSRLFTIKSGLREGNLNRLSVDLAIKELKEVARLDKNNAEAWALLGEFYQATSQKEESLAALKNWAAAPASSDTRFFQYMTNRELSPDAAAARLAEGLLSAGRSTEALAAVRRAIALNPENKEYGDLLGQVIAAGGIDDRAAIIELQRMVAADPTNTDTVKLLARVQARAGRVDDAAKTLREAISRQPKGDREQQLLRTSLAQLYADALRYTDAIAVYEEQLKEQGIGNAPLTTDEERAVAGRILQRMIEIYKKAGRASDVIATTERMHHLLGK
jgi:cytochrome c-type biogenesis protein CcmH/NrfG